MNDENQNLTSPPEDPISRVTLDTGSGSGATPSTSRLNLDDTSKSPSRWPFIAFLLVLMLGLGGWLAWRYWQAFNSSTWPQANSIDNQLPSATPINESEVDTSTWQTYRNEEYGFEFLYPADYTVEAGARNDPTVIVFASSTRVFRVLSTPGGEFGDEYHLIFSGNGRLFKQILSTFRFLE